VFDEGALGAICGKVADACALGVEVGIVVGGGNIFRGAIGDSCGWNRIAGDQMGMLATVINGLALKEFLSKKGLKAVIQSALAVDGVCERFNAESACKHLAEKTIVIFVGGTGNPFFSTDTAAVLRAREIGAGVILKATKVNGVYDKDPKKFPDAKRIAKVTFAEALSKRLEIMDMTAFSLCNGSGIPIIIFDLAEENSICRVLKGDSIGSEICN
jgi:uridylate kinase